MPALAYRSRMPRPSDKEVQESIAASIELGHPLDTAGQIAGLGHDTARQWYVKGSAQLESGDELGSHAAFAATIKAAEAKMVDIQLHHIQRDAKNKGGWTAAMTLLERRRPKDFGRNVQVETTATVRYVHELGPGASKAIAAHILELEGQQPPTESDTGGSDSPPTPLLPETLPDSSD